MAILSPAQLAAGSPVFVLTIEWAGQSWRWSTLPLDVTWTRLDGSGTTTIRTDGGLDALEVERSLAAISDTPELRTLSTDLVWPEDVALLVAEGHDLSSGEGELAVLTDGMDWGERVVLLRGRVSQPEYGGDGEPVSLSIVEEVYDDVASLLRPTQRVTEEKFATAKADAIGRYYPIVIGQPGYRIGRDGVGKRTAGVPAHAIAYDSTLDTTDTLLVCAGRVAATQCRIAYEVYPGQLNSTSALTIVYGTDADGEVYGYVDISGESAIVRTAGKYWSIWQDGAGTLSPIRTGGVTGLGEAMLWAALRSSTRVDVARFQAVADRLTWPVAGYVDEPCSPMEWLADNLLPLAPVAMTYGLDGLGPVLWRHDARRVDAVRTVTAGEGYHRVGRVSYTRKPRDVVNEIRLMWARDASQDDYLEETVLTPTLARSTGLTGAELSGVRQGAILDSQRSESAYRLVRTTTLESDVVSDATTAWRVVAWRARASSLSPREVEYDCTTEALELEEGDVVILVDAELHLDVVAQVARIVVSDTPTIRIALQILDPAVSSSPDPGPYVTADDPNYGEGQ